MPHCRISRTNAIWTDPTRRDRVSGQTSGAAGLRSKPQAVGSNSKENQPCFLELGLEDQQRAPVRVVVANIKAHDFADPKSRGIQEGLIGNSNCLQFEIRGEYWPGCGGILNVASDLGRKGERRRRSGGRRCLLVSSRHTESIRTKRVCPASTILSAPVAWTRLTEVFWPAPERFSIDDVGIPRYRRLYERLAA